VTTTFPFEAGDSPVDYYYYRIISSDPLRTVIEFQTATRDTPTDVLDNSVTATIGINVYTFEFPVQYFDDRIILNITGYDEGSKAGGNEIVGSFTAFEFSVTSISELTITIADVAVTSKTLDYSVAPRTEFTVVAPAYSGTVFDAE
jgi:hypothetical protein